MPPLEHEHLSARTSEIRGRRQSVVAATDDDGVVFLRHGLERRTQDTEHRSHKEHPQGMSLHGQKNSAFVCGKHPGNFVGIALLRGKAVVSVHTARTSACAFCQTRRSVNDVAGGRDMASLPNPATSF